MYSTSIMVLNNGLQHLVDWRSWSKTFSWLDSNVLCNANVFVNFCFILAILHGISGYTVSWTLIPQNISTPHAMYGARPQQAIHWLYGDGDYKLPDGFAFDPSRRLYLCGDWCYNGRVEGAYLLLVLLGWVVVGCWVRCGLGRVVYDSKQHFAHWVGSPFFP